MKNNKNLLVLLACLAFMTSACTKKSKFEVPAPDAKKHEEDAPAPIATETTVVTGERRFDPNAPATPQTNPSNTPITTQGFNPLKEPAHNPLPVVIPVDGVNNHNPLGGEDNITRVTITKATSTVAVSGTAITTEKLKLSQVAQRTGSEEILVTDLYAKLMPGQNSKAAEIKAISNNSASSPITLVIYKDQLETIPLNHAPTVSRREYVQSGLAVLDGNQLSANKKILGYVKNGEAFYVAENLETQLTKEDVAKIVASGACDIISESGPCVLIRIGSPVALVVGSIVEGEQTNVYYDSFSDNEELISAKNVLLAAFNLDSVLYSPKLLNPPVESEVTTVVESDKGKKVWGRCSIDADIEIEKVSFLLSFENGTGYGTATCRYNNGVVKSEKIKITLKAFGLGLALDFKNDPFKTVQRVAVKASGLGYTPNVKDMACKYSSIGADATILGLGLGIDTGVIGSNSTLNEDITVTGCKEGTGALAFTFQAIDAEGFQFSVTPIEFKNIYIELVD